MNIELTHIAAPKKRIIMTPKLQQAIKMLRMSQLELSQFITRQLEQNPLLEEDEIQTEQVEIVDRKDGNNLFQPIIPEVSIKKVGGEYHVHTNDDTIPRLRLNPFYLNMLDGQNREVDSETKKRLEQQRNSAVDLISSINQRRRTIIGVTEAIFKIQADFLEQGTRGLKSLTLKQIAAVAGVHESTVSRVISNKYVETPQGIYKLKFFFSPGLPTNSGEDVSSTSVKDRIKEMIDYEITTNPLSDQAIANALKARGIHIARRTVQKYREELGILSSGKRKAEKLRTN